MEWIEKVIRIDSVTDRSNEDLVRFLAPLLKECDLKVEEQKFVENGVTFKNLLAFSHEPTSPDLLVLNTHLDTVSGGDPALWTKTGGNPFRATRIRDRLYGLGTADVKIDFLCKLWAARLARPWGRPFALVGTYGEERGLVGAANLLQSKKITPRYALVGEPSNLELIYAHKGHMVFTVGIQWSHEKKEQTVKKTWKGKSAHSSTPELGENALQKGLNDILKRGFGIVSFSGGSGSNKIPDYCEAELTGRKTRSTETLFSVLKHFEELSRELKKRRDTRFSPSYPTLSLNIARMHEGTLELTFDIRVLPDLNTARLQEKVRAVEKIPSVKVVHLVIDEPLKGQKNGKFMTLASDALKSAGVKVVRKTKASSTEAALYQKYGAEAIVFGPGISTGNVHRPNEFNSFRQIAQATRFYSAMLQAGGNA